MNGKVRGAKNRGESVRGEKLIGYQRGPIRSSGAVPSYRKKLTVGQKEGGPATTQKR